MRAIEVPIIYQVKGYRPRRKTCVTDNFKEMITLNVSEADENDAPVGAVLRFNGCEERLRFFNGSWWMKDEAENAAAAQLRSLASNRGLRQADLFEDDSLALVLSGGATRKKYASSGIPIEQLNLVFPRVESSGRQEAIDRATRLTSEGMMFFGDDLYAKVQEPHISLYISKKEIVKSVSLGGFHRSFPDLAYFPMNCEREVLSVADAILDYGGQEQTTHVEVEYIFGSLNDMESSLFTAGRLKEAAQDALSNTKQRIHAYNREFAVSWFDLKEAYEEIVLAEDQGQEASEDSMDRIAEALASMCVEAKEIENYSTLWVQRWHEIHLAHLIWSTRAITYDSDVLPSP